MVEISVSTENILLESSSSVGTTLPEEKVAELPLVSGNVLDLMKVMGGVNMTDSPTFGADRTTFAGISAANVNVQRDGVTVNDVRWATGANSPVFLNQELVGEFKLVIAPVDAEMGRGSGQVQVVTKSGANAFHGSGVWNILNSKLDAQQWSRQLGRDADPVAECARIHAEPRRTDNQEQDVLLCIVGSADRQDPRTHGQSSCSHALR